MVGIAGESGNDMIARLEERIIELIAFGVFAVDGDQAEVDRQIANCRAQIDRLQHPEGYENDKKEC